MKEEPFVGISTRLESRLAEMKAKVTAGER
ncbi:hypothetical protein COLO4_11515 [Corchorus olitorius]|uniref:Uncharacterized protein n=1 Tax=Corchorus olitorius TaxID=93759 RepID=A0A1R3K466_9ROSI|nr:hypothetical protein COLO4_11515 [Corchorus olitorius]